MTWILTQALAADAFSAINVSFAKAQARCQQVQGMATATVNDAISLAEYLDRQDQNIGAAVATVDNQSLIDYAQAQFNAPGYDAVAEYTATRNALNALAAFIDTNIPRTGSPEALIPAYDWTLTTGRTPTLLTGGQKSALDTEIAIFLATLG